MTPAELQRLVGIVSAHDGRSTGTADVVVWTAGVGDLDYADCEAAVFAHIRAGTDDRGRQVWLTPGMVRTAVRAIRRDRLERAEDHTPPDADPDDPRAYAEALRARRRLIAAGQVLVEQTRIDPAARDRVRQAITGTFPSPS